VSTQDHYAKHNDTQCNDAQHNDKRHYDTKHTDTQCNDAQHNDKRHYDTKHNDTQHNNILHNIIFTLIQRTTLSSKYRASLSQVSLIYNLENTIPGDCIKLLTAVIVAVLQ
jgi:hypothetical protein